MSRHLPPRPAPKPYDPQAYLKRLAAKRKAMKDYAKYLEASKRLYPGGSLSK